MKYKELLKKALLNRETKEVYDQLEPEFDLLKKILTARRQLGITQIDVGQDV